MCLTVVAVLYLLRICETGCCITSEILSLLDTIMQKAKAAELLSASQYEKFACHQLIEAKVVQSVSEFGTIY